MAILKFLSLLPLSILYILSDILYVLLFKIARYRVLVVKKNLKNSFPEKSEAEILAIRKEFYHNLCDIVAETIKTLSLSSLEIVRRAKAVNIELPKKYLDKGQCRRSALFLIEKLF